LWDDQLRIVAELDGTGALVSRFVYTTSVNMPEYMVKSGSTYRILTDQLGSPRLVVDVATGTVTQRMDYDEFGRVLLDTSPGLQPFGFAGGFYDIDTRLVRFGARDYDAEVGRWIAKDLMLLAGGSFGLYEYAAGDPINLTDVFGLQEEALPWPKPKPPPKPPKPPTICELCRDEWLNCDSNCRGAYPIPPSSRPSSCSERPKPMPKPKPLPPEEKLKECRDRCWKIYDDCKRAYGCNWRP
jgi:RHS repeat-associated protein